MGTAEAARVASACAVALALVGPTAHAFAESRCTRTTDKGDRFAACFDPGNRLFLTAATDGYGGGVALRHVVRFDDEPDLIWKLEHGLLRARGSQYSGRVHAVLYSGRYLRHSRDGHVVLPFSVGRKLFLPFDIGADARVGEVAAELGAPRVDVGVFDGTALIDLGRSASFRRRLCIGAELRWEMQVQRDPLAITDHVVAPFSAAVLDAHAESQSGLTAADVRLVAGKAWSSEHGWHTRTSAEVSLERILIAINDRPLSLILGARYLGADDDLRGQIGLRMTLFQQMDRRVVLDPLEVTSRP